LNRRHKDFQSSALPTELSCQSRSDIEPPKWQIGKTQNCEKFPWLRKSLE
jgi:hypothetical protein